MKQITYTTLIFLAAFMLSTGAYADFCDDGSRREGNNLFVCGTGESPVRPEAEAISRHSIQTEAAFSLGNRNVKYHVNPRRLSCEQVYSDLYGTQSYWRCVRLVEYIIEER